MSIGRGLKGKGENHETDDSFNFHFDHYLFNGFIFTHHLVIIIDGETVITGSFNFTKAAEESNAENLLEIHDKKLAERYIKNWQNHAQHSEVYVGKGK